MRLISSIPEVDYPNLSRPQLRLLLTVHLHVAFRNVDRGSLPASMRKWRFLAAEGGSFCESGGVLTSSP